MFTNKNNNDNDNDNHNYIFYFLGIFFVYLALRIIAWSNSILIEYTDSLGYIDWTRIFLEFDLAKLIYMDPDATPFYPFFSAIFSLLPVSVETGARLCSLVFSCLLFVAVVKIGRRLANPLDVVLGLILLSFSAALIPLSFTVMSEPSYIATVYLGLWLFWVQFKNPNLVKAGFLGIVFGFSFLNRLEGIIYIAIIPFLQAIHFFFVKDRIYTFKNLSAWTVVFIVMYSAVAAPQIWRVSNIADGFALNGRQVWSVVLNNPDDDRSYKEKIHGLDYSPSERNIDYLQYHPKAWQEMTPTFDLSGYIRTVYQNLKDLRRHGIPEIYGYIGFAFFFIGLLALYRMGRPYELFIIVTFVGLSLVPPLLHNVVIRHIAVIAPIMFLVIGIGIAYVCRMLLVFAGERKYLVPLLLFILVFTVVGPSKQRLWDVVMRPPVVHKEYGPEELKEPVKIIQSIASELNRQPVVAGERGFLAYYANARQVYIPYANLSAFLRFIELNNVDFVYLKESRLTKNPFYLEYLEYGLPENYLRLYSGLGSHEDKVELYRVVRQKG